MNFCETVLWNNHYLEKIIHGRKVEKVRENIGTEKTRRRGMRDMQEGDKNHRETFHQRLSLRATCPHPKYHSALSWPREGSHWCRNSVCESDPLMGKEPLVFRAPPQFLGISGWCLVVFLQEQETRGARCCYGRRGWASDCVGEGSAIWKGERSDRSQVGGLGGGPGHSHALLRRFPSLWGGSLGMEDSLSKIKQLSRSRPAPCL